MSQDMGIDIDFDAEEERAIEGRAIALQRATDPELGKRPEPLMTDAVTLAGKQFRLSQKVGLMPLLKFAHAANSGMDTGDMRSFSALYEMLRDVIQEPVPACGKCVRCRAGEEDDCPIADAGDWEKFEDHAVMSKAGADDLLAVVTDAIELITARPTESPSASSNGSPSTSGRQTARNSSRRAAGSAASRRGKRAT